MREPTDLADALERIRCTVAIVTAGDLTPNDPFRGLHAVDDDAPGMVGEATLAASERFVAIADALGLDAIEREVLACCVAPELHPDFRRVIGFLHDDVEQWAPTPWLIAHVIRRDEVPEAAVLAALRRDGSLRASGAVRLEREDRPVAASSLTVAPQIVAQLLGADLEPPHFGALRRVDAGALPLGREAVRAQLAGALATRGVAPLLVTGGDGALLVAAACGGAVVADLRATLAEPALLQDLFVAAALEGRAPVLDGLAGLEPERLAPALAAIFSLPRTPVLWAPDGHDVPVAVQELRPLVVAVPSPSLAERTAAFRAAADVDGVEDLARDFRLDVGQIAHAAELAARAVAAEDATLDASALRAGARAASSQQIAGLAELLPPGPGSDALVLPARTSAALEVLRAFLAHRDAVLEDWGYGGLASTAGLTAMFSGESGTGKTFSARVIAGEAGLDVFRIDLSMLYSKWVGETEKNLDRIFRAAEGSNAIVFFDEADVVFGKRGEASGGQDHYGNLGAAYLLQRIESFTGAVVLATNFRSNIDEAFLRRMDVIVDFPPPDVAERRRLWETLPPADAPLARDIDVDLLARRFELAGGGIRNCLVTAAMLAAGDGGTITMAHVVEAVAFEYRKLGRLTLESDFGEFHRQIRVV